MQEATLQRFFKRIEDKQRHDGDQPLPVILGRVYAAGSSELTCSGVVHFHLLVGGVSQEFRLYWMEEWNQMAGFARIYPFNRQRAEMNRYCFKYCCKGGHFAESWWHRLEIPALPVMVPQVRKHLKTE